MKTTLDIDAELLKQARDALGTATIKDTVNASLSAVVRQQQLQDLVDALGTIPLDLSPSRLRKQRRKRSADASR